MDLILTNNGTITIPKSLLEEQNLVAGTKFRISVENGVISLIPKKRLKLNSNRRNLKKGALGELIESRKKEQTS